MFFKETYSGIYPKEPREVASSNRNWAKFAKQHVFRKNLGKKHTNEVNQLSKLFFRIEVCQILVQVETRV